LLSSNCLRSLLYQTSKSPLEPHRSGGVFVCEDTSFLVVVIISCRGQ